MTLSQSQDFETRAINSSRSLKNPETVFFKISSVISSLSDGQKPSGHSGDSHEGSSSVSQNIFLGKTHMFEFFVSRTYSFLRLFITKFGCRGSFSTSSRVECA